VDDIGRRLVVGPAEIGLETAAMLSMALPIAVVGLINAERRKHQLLYAIAMCILIAATISTYKKAALIGVAAGVLLITCYRPRSMIKMAPVAVMVVIAIHVLSPGALGSVTSQLQGNNLTRVSTTTHRTDAYDAIRPDVWSHPLLGEGYGGYDQVRNRILDNTVLDLLIGTGILGVGAFLNMGISVIVAAHPLIRARDRLRAPHALACAAAACVFVTVSFLYDSMAFPHVPYIFLTMAAFVAVVVAREDDRPDQRAPLSPYAGRRRATRRRRTTVTTA
jgi:O-antigen ligase